MLKNQMFFATFFGVEVIVLMVIARLLFIGPISFSRSAISSPSTPSRIGLKQSSQSSQSPLSNTSNIYIKWEYKTLVVLYPMNQSASIINSEGTQPPCTLYSNALGVSQTGQGNSPSQCLVEDGNTELMQRLNNLGEQGWELVSVTSYGTSAYVFVFKRLLSN